MVVVVVGCGVVAIIGHRIQGRKSGGPWKCNGNTVRAKHNNTPVITLKWLARLDFSERRTKVDPAAFRQPLARTTIPYWTFLGCLCMHFDSRGPAPALGKVAPIEICDQLFPDEMCQDSSCGI
jgi:hypothetical protein